MPSGIYKRKEGHYTKERNKKISDALTGKKLSDETKDKIRQANLGKIMPINIREKISKKTEGKIVSIETRKKLSDVQKGDKAYWWRGGITKENEILRHSFEYKLWRKAVFERDNFTCIWCGIKGGWSKEQKKQISLNADHIKRFADYPELRFAIDNGRTLCVPCHKTTDTYGGVKKVKKNG